VNLVVAFDLSLPQCAIAAGAEILRDTTFG
jgi:hypothetical protein